ncbi:MAG: hypothetical protein O2960_20085 [Verrucomicrobia bacterium]|jgi:hypothetical protein|nr:hypothetical protein [Verrucomicrobiota bacterium]
MNNFNPVGAWNKSYAEHTVMPLKYGDELSYRVSAALLDDLETVEDWGCGCAYAKRFFHHASYLGIDGSKSKWNDITEDLRLRKSKPDGILLRHVLEHNDNWKTLLINAIECSQKRLVIVFFLPLNLTRSSYIMGGDGYPCNHLAIRELFEVIGDLEMSEIFFSGGEKIWFVQK